ncbi:MAG: hypothetical protein MUE51_00160 [Thermoleophilia bacterium]|jgi:hypothetical protein|nr:hypothetical protein [Thermoleophilia bacterium]
MSGHGGSPPSPPPAPPVRGRRILALGAAALGLLPAIVLTVRTTGPSTAPLALVMALASLLCTIVVLVRGRPRQLGWALALAAGVIWAFVLVTLVVLVVGGLPAGSD